MYKPNISHSREESQYCAYYDSYYDFEAYKALNEVFCPMCEFTHECNTLCQANYDFSFEV